MGGDVRLIKIGGTLSKATDIIPRGGDKKLKTTHSEHIEDEDAVVAIDSHHAPRNEMTNWWATMKLKIVKNVQAVRKIQADGGDAAARIEADPQSEELLILSARTMLGESHFLSDWLNLKNKKGARNHRRLIREEHRAIGDIEDAAGAEDAAEVLRKPSETMTTTSGATRSSLLRVWRMTMTFGVMPICHQNRLEVARRLRFSSATD